MSIISKLVNRVEMMLVKAIIETINDSDELQLVKISGLNNEVQDDIERIQNYGMTSAPPKGSEAFVAYINGNRDHGVVIACDNGEHRVAGLNDGEVAVYSQHGQQIALENSGDVNATVPGLFNVGNATDFVALSTVINIFLDTLATTVSPGGTPVVTPAPGSPCPIAVAIRTAMTAAFPPALSPAAVECSKLRSE